ncbi:MAG: hypothetical protein QXK07_07140 [Desulfurococcaceae archaeon]
MSDVVIREKKVVVNVWGFTGYLVADRVYENIINRNLLCVLSRGFGGTTCFVYPITGGSYTIDRVLEVRDSSGLRAGTGTTTPSTNDTDVPGYVETVAPTVALAKVNNAYEIRFYGAPTTNISTLGLAQTLHTLSTGGSRFYDPFLYTRVLASIPAGTSFMYAIRIPHPLNANFSAYLYGWFTRGTPTMMDIDGVARSVQGWNPHPNLVAYILVSDADVDDSIDRATVPSYTLVRASSGFVSGVRQGSFTVSATFTPSEPYTVRLVGMVKELADTGGTVRRFMMALKRLPTPVTLEPGKQIGVTFNLINRM